MFCQSEESEIKKCKGSGVTIDYVNPTNTMIVCGPPGQVNSTVKLFEKYNEKQLQCSPQQWATLKDGKHFDDFLAPFQHNPAVKIIKQPLTTSFVVVGLTDAVGGAYQYLFKTLNKCIKTERLGIHVPNLFQNFDKLDFM